MIWLNFLHLYQPANQQKDILKAVVDQCYFPLFKKINEIDDLSITINITGALLELFERDNYIELLDLIRSSIKSNKVELAGSCKYHAFTPLLPREEIERQIVQNNETISRILNIDFKPKGFFPPEMGYAPFLNPIIKDLGFEWIIVDEIAYKKGECFPNNDVLYKTDNDLLVFFRDRRVSNLIMSAVARDIVTLKNSISGEMSKPYIVTGMDGETFGHHRIGFEKFLFEVFEDTSLNLSSISSFIDSCKLESEIVSLHSSTWASSVSDINNSVQFLSWNDKDNEIHKFQWEFLNFVLKLVEDLHKDLPIYKKVRLKMDRALGSDHFWWASAKPWWSLEMIEDGAYRLLDVVTSIEGLSKEILFKAYSYYHSIVSKAATWQREGIVREISMKQNEVLRIPFKDRTLGKGGSETGVYYAFIDTMKKQERAAADKGDYERAILWRDAIYKLENKYDIYDAINVIDLLRIEVGNGVVEDTISKYKKKFQEIRGGQPEQRGS